MNYFKFCRGGWSIAMTILMLAGCGPAYHSYSSCHINCRYCPPAPLPYTYADNCACHSDAAGKYLRVVTAAPAQDQDAKARHPVVAE